MSDRFCIRCGKTLLPRQKRYCGGTMLKVCPTCGKPFEAKCRYKQQVYCCNLCGVHSPIRKSKAIETNIKRYGCPNPMQNENVSKKTLHTQIKKYGSLAFNTPISKVKANINSHTKEAHAKRRASLAKTHTQKLLNGEPITRFNTVSRVNLKMKEQLESKLGLKFDVEFVVEECFFDLRCGNLLVEINPSVSHASNYSFNELVKLHNGAPRPKDYHFNRQQVAERNGYTLVQVFDFTHDPVDIIAFYAAKLGLISPVDYDIKEIRFDRPQRHIDYHTGHELHVYDAGIYYVKTSHVEQVTSISKYASTQDSFDVETVSDRFDLSGVDSHNCRTRVVGNVYDPERSIVAGRGNFAFVTINLPALGILADHSVPTFFELFDDRINAAIRSLEERFEYIGKKHVYNFPFLMGQGVYLDSDKLNWDSEIAEVIKHASLSVGFVGLAECLVALMGVHHGESEKAQKLGLDIVWHLRKRMDEMAEKTGLNWTCFATPAEGLCSRAAKLNRKRFGLIKGVTDRDYVTNSSHVPVYYPISAFQKMRIEGPYHELCNAGHIGYVEVDGDISKNLQAFEQLVRLSEQVGMNYFSVNHPVDMCPVCGFVGVIGDTCPRCGFKEGEGISVEKLQACGCLEEAKRRLNFD